MLQFKLSIIMIFSWGLAISQSIQIDVGIASPLFDDIYHVHYEASWGNYISRGDWESKSTMSFGMNYLEDKKINLSSNIGYFKTEVNYLFGIQDQEYNLNWQFFYLNTIATKKIRLSGDVITLYLGLGPRLDYILSSDMRLGETYWSSSYYSIAANTLIGFRFSPDDNWWMGLNLQYNYSLTGIQGEPDVGRCNYLTLTFQIGLSLAKKEK